MFKKMGVRMKMILGFVLLYIVAIATSLTGIHGIKSTLEANAGLIKRQIPAALSLSALKEAQLFIMVSERALFVPGMKTSELIQEQYKSIDFGIKGSEKAVAAYDALQKDEEKTRMWNDLLEIKKQILEQDKKIVSLSKERDVLYAAGKDISSLEVQAIESEAVREILISRGIILKANDMINALIEKENQYTKTSLLGNVDDGKRAIRLMIILLIGGFILGFTASYLAAHSVMNILRAIKVQFKKVVAEVIEGRLSARADAMETNWEFREITEGLNNTLDAVTTPLNVAANYIDKISNGNMPPVITEQYKGDFNIIINNLNILINTLNDITAKAQLIANGDLTIDLKMRSDNDVMISSLKGMVKSTASIISEFQTAANNISASSQQMSSTSQTLSQGASEQASSAEEVSSSMEEMAANIQQNNENARTTEKIALSASEEILKVNEAADATLKYMRDIADKVSIIGEIARQTNILALNAAVEAARAGEHGKGFAVVAAEVRKLAERSQVAAVEIENLTKNSVRATEDSGNLLSTIAPDINKTAKLVQEIAAASDEQTSGAEQVNNAIQQLNNVTQQNAAAAEEMATSSEELASQAQQLIEMISYFKLETTNEIRRFGAVSERNVTTKKSTYSFEENPKVKKKESYSFQKGININMGKDNMDANFDKF